MLRGGARQLLPECCKERVVALADPDPARIAFALEQARKTLPSADTGAIKTFADYRQLFDALGKELDAVVIATPNHQHAPPALQAMLDRPSSAEPLANDGDSLRARLRAW